MAIQPIEAGMVVHQVLDAEGNLVGDMPDLSTERLLALYRAMLLGRAFSNKIIALQRQGRATNSSVSIGQEATSVGLAAPMQQQDWLASSYREIPSLIVRGIPPSTLIYMRRGYTPAYPKEARCLPFQIVIGTQIIHAVGLAQETPEERYTISLGKAHTLQEGSDVSIFAYGAMVPIVLDAARQALQEMGLSSEIIDLRTVWPLDEAAIVTSVEKTGRAIVVHEAPRAGGVSAEVTAVINDRCLYSLLKPVERVTGYDTPYPSPGLEDYYLPTPAKVLDAIKRLMEP